MSGSDSLLGFPGFLPIALVALLGCGVVFYLVLRSRSQSSSRDLTTSIGVGEVPGYRRWRLVTLLVSVAALPLFMILEPDLVWIPWTIIVLATLARILALEVYRKRLQQP